MPRTSDAQLNTRRLRVEEALLRNDLEGLVIFAHGSALGWGTRTHPYMRWLCDWDGLNTPSILVVLAGRPAVILTPQMFLYQARAEITTISDVRYVERSSLGREVATILRQAGLNYSRLGFVGRDEVPLALWECLRQELPATEWVDFTAVLNPLIIEKGRLELMMTRQAAEICDLMLERLASELRTGKSAFQIKAELERVAHHEGCEHCLTWLTVGPNADFARLVKHACLRVPQEGDQVLLGIYLMHEGSWGHAIRTGNLGFPTEDHRYLFDVAFEMEEAGLAALRPGVDLNDVQAAFEAVFDRRFGSLKTQSIFRFTNAHGIGSFYDEPILGEPFPQPYAIEPGKPTRTPPLAARPGMVFEFHPNFFIPGRGAAAIGDMVVVSETGCELLTRFPRTLLVC